MLHIDLQNYLFPQLRLSHLVSGDPRRLIQLRK